MPPWSPQADAIFRNDLKKVLLQTDRMFFWLLIGQWLFAIFLAVVWSPRTWIAQYWSVHQHVVAAAVLGGLFAVYPLYLIRRAPGARYTRHVIAIGQMLQSALLVHVTGGRIETHFHVFGSLALLAFYRDWPVLITAAAVVAADHVALGAWFPLSVYGVVAATIWRSVEHAAWVVFEVLFLTMSCRTGIRELRAIAERQVQLEVASAALQEANARLELRVQERTQELQRQTAALERSNQELDDFTYIVSHDLKEPLRTIDAFTRFTLDDHGAQLAPEGREYLERVRANAKCMSALINDLLGLSRLAREPNQFAPVEIAALLEEVQARFAHVLKEKQVQLVVQPSLPPLVADRVRLGEVFANLVSNAIKYNDKPVPRIEIGCQAVDGAYRFSVRDNGPGIDPQYHQKIFEIFQRLGKKEQQEGTGVGLTIIKKIVELHQGRVWVESVVGEGATFYFTIAQQLQLHASEDSVNGQALQEKGGQG